MASYQCNPQLLIIDLNNKAATSITMKKFRRANDRLLEALEICSAGMKEQKESSLSTLTGEDGDNDGSSDFWNERCIQSPPAPRSCGSSSSTSSGAQDISMPFPDLMVEDEDEEEEDDHQGGGKEDEEDPQQEQGYLYDHAIRLPTMHPTDYGSLPSLSFLASNVLFNLALSVQLGAMEEMKQIQYLTSEDEVESILSQFERSIRLYEMGYDFQKEHDAPISLIILATVNNLGQAYKAIGDYEIADKCFAHLLSMLMVYVSFNDDDGGLTTSAAQEDVDDNFQLEDFFGNALPSMMTVSAELAESSYGSGDNNDSHNKHRIYLPPHAAAA